MVEENLDSDSADLWLAKWGSSPDPFSDPALTELLNAVDDTHFMMVVSLRRRNGPISLVLRLQRTVRPAGEELRKKLIDSEARLDILPRLHRREIELQPLVDSPVISRRGEGPCSFHEALAVARNLARWGSCSKIYTLNAENIAHA